ncbi:MAG TPA: hypothetical protein DEB40_05185 [Elusimicrobia bacterium]|nr:hypothetical protein [Elusimicrobiota bacterium]HBT61118.1 hypothetical protein [Elusimicrobiota bacterium]
MVAAGLMAGLVAGCATAPVRDFQARQDWARAIIGNWSNFSRLSADNLMERYGLPDRIESGRLLWHGRGPWKRIEVWDVMPFYGSDLGPDNLEQTISYPAASSKRKELAAFSKKLRVSKDGTELSARSTGEERNFLALNLADEIVRGLKEPVGARRFYDLTIQLAAAGRSSRYMQGLLFMPGPAQR